ncbi:kinase-like domain-containing protein, partial [Gigaspora rosea]
EKLNLLSDIAFDIKTIHSHNIIHLDLHSGNILQKNLHSAYIGDFGISVSVDEALNMKSENIYGFLPYLAPEILTKRIYEKASDIYSFGMIMWEISSGRSVFFNRAHDSNLLIALMDGERPQILDGTAQDYKEFMERCWSSDPKDRPSAEEILKVIESWKSNEEILKKFDESDINMKTIINKYANDKSKLISTVTNNFSCVSLFAHLYNSLSCHLYNFIAIPENFLSTI